MNTLNLITDYEADKYFVGAEFELKQGTIKILGKVKTGGKTPYYVVQFQDEHGVIRQANKIMIKKGRITNPYFPSIYKKGYIGEGKYNIHHKAFKSWRSYLALAYDKNHTYYTGRPVGNDWLNYQNFAEWFDKVGL